MKCSFAFPGTYGHECGQPAVKVAVFVSKPSENSIPAYMTRSGLFYTGRCEACLKLKGGENTGMLRLEPVADQVNDWVPVNSRTGKPWQEVA